MEFLLLTRRGRFVVFTAFGDLSANLSNMNTGTGCTGARRLKYCILIQICFLIQDQAFDFLDAPIGRVSSVDAPQAYSKSLETAQLPGKEKVLKAALKLL